MRTGLTRVAALAERLGLPRPQAYPSMALGTAEATPLEVASAYTAFASAGRVARPSPVLRVDGAAEADAAQPEQSEQVLKPATAYMLTDMLSDVIDRGTARAARGAFKGTTAVAGKTGTSRDGWFAGYTPNLVCVVWVGFDDGGELDLTGADAALPAWTEFVRRAVELRPELGGEEFARPASVTFVDVDPETGLAAAPSCPQRERVALAPAFVPDHECSLHGDPWGLLALAASSSQPTGLTPTAHARAPAVASYDSHAARAAYATAAAAAGASPTEDVSQTPAEAPRATRVEVGRDGRRRLTNDMRVAPDGADDWQE
jgi:penicillin-binding protein 1B